MFACCAAHETRRRGVSRSLPSPARPNNTHHGWPHPRRAQASHTQNANCTISSRVALSRVSMMSHFVTAPAGGFLLPGGFFLIGRSARYGCGTRAVRRCGRVHAEGDRGDEGGRDADADAGGRGRGEVQRARARAAVPSAARAAASACGSSWSALGFRRAALAFTVRLDALVFPAISNRHASWLCTKQTTRRTKVSHDCVCRPDAVEHVGVWRSRPAQS